MKFKAYDKAQKKYINNCFVDSEGTPHIGRGDEGLNRAINDYYRQKGDDLGGDYLELDFTDWYAIENIELEWYDDEGNKINSPHDKKGQGISQTQSPS